MIDFGGGFQFPGCMLPNLISGGTSPSGNCNPNELTIRHSFKKVVDTDYEPLDWDGQQFETYGAFTTEREGYARDYGLVDKARRRYISRYNIWERSHHYTDATAMTGATACKVDDDCGAIGSVKGMSHCDTHHEKCTLPFKDRDGEADRLALLGRQPGALLRLDPRGDRGVGHRDARSGRHGEVRRVQALHPRSRLRRGHHRQLRRRGRRPLPREGDQRVQAR